MEIIQAGCIDYSKGLELQKQIWQQVVNNQRDSAIVFCEHPPVYTLGKSAKMENLLINLEQLNNIGAAVHQTDRGGDITFHGPGQLVGYPIIRLEDYKLGVRRYVNLLEDTIIETCKLYNIKSCKIDGLTGIWIQDIQRPDRKIAAIGIKVSRGVTMHGFAFNIHTNLDYFNYMIPCGILNKQVTSILAETNQLFDSKDVSTDLIKILKENLKV